MAVVGYLARGLCVSNGQGYQSLEKIAQRYRRKFFPGLSNDEAIPFLDLFEGLRKHTVVIDGEKYPTNYGVRDLGPSVEAQTEFNKKHRRFDVVLAPATYDAIDAGTPGRDGFTLCHEIGHLVLHADVCLRLATIPHQRALMRGGHPAYYDSEWQANVFASALAMPADGLAMLESRGRLTVRAIQDRYKVSEQAADVRLSIFQERRDEIVMQTGVVQRRNM